MKIGDRWDISITVNIKSCFHRNLRTLHKFARDGPASALSKVLVIVEVKITPTFSLQVLGVRMKSRSPVPYLGV